MTTLQKLRAMTPIDVIRTMTAALRDPDVRVSMSTFGSVIFEDYESSSGKTLCVGCAYTNFAAKVAGVHFTQENIANRPKVLRLSEKNNDALESAIDSLRYGVKSKSYYYETIVLDPTETPDREKAR